MSKKRYLKTPEAKLETKLNSLRLDPLIQRKKNVFTIRGRKLLSITTKKIRYTNYRYFSRQKEDLVQEGFTVDITINHDNLNLLSTGVINPPIGTKRLVDIFTRLTKGIFTHIEIGAKVTKINGHKLFITKGHYDTIMSIDLEERKSKTVRTDNRIIPFLNSEFGLELDFIVTKRDYSLILKEIIASGDLSKEDVLGLMGKLDSGEINQVVISKQIDKQVEWLIETIEELLEETNLTTGKAKEFGKRKFGYLKTDVTGPEGLIEKILTDYGRNTLFGVPALLNINKYVVTEGSQSKSQFDLILINHLGDVEVVELKRTDEVILDYDSSRGKFYPSKSLSIAIAQAERYISAVTNDNNEEYKIGGKKIREFLFDELGGTMLVEAIRPKALVMIGSWKTLAKPYGKLSANTQKKVKKSDYDGDSVRAYQEIRGSYKNINILNYSEILEHARTRLQIS